MERIHQREKSALKKGKWSIEEDHKLIEYINRYGIWNWTEMPKAAGLLRSGKSCRLRWVNYLRPHIKHGNFTREEEEAIFQMHEMMGNKWSTMAATLPGRTDNEIKNYWHSHLKKQLQELRARSQVSRGAESSQTNSFEISNLLLSNHNASELASRADEFINIPALVQLPSSLCPSPNSSSDLGPNKNQNIEENFGLEAIEELLKFWEQPSLSEEIMEMEYLQFQDMCVDPPAFVLPHTELWSSEPVSSYGFYNDPNGDIWENLSLPADMNGVKEP